MNAILEFFQNLHIDLPSMLKVGGVLLLGCLLMSLFGRFIFGKKSALNNAVSSAIGILFIYCVTVVLKGLGAQFDRFLVPMPFVSLSGDQLTFFDFSADYTAVCSQLLSMIILAFLVNIVDGWLPKGKNVFAWVFFRALTVAIAMAMHLIVTGLFTKYLPEGIVTYAPAILLVLLLIMLLTGALKVVVGVVLTTVNPLIAALYTFFFANIVGKQVTKAVLTTALLAGLVILLKHLGIVAISVAAAALIAYIPFLIILIVLWYIVNRLL